MEMEIVCKIMIELFQLSHFQFPIELLENQSLKPNWWIIANLTIFNFSILI